MSNFNENTRVQVPAAMHLVRLGYTYLSSINDDAYDHSTNILKDIFVQSIMKLNPLMTETEAENALADIIRKCRNNEDLGREFYSIITSQTGIKYIDFENPENNQWHVTTEFTCENERTHDNFRPDITIFVNGLPLVFIEVKKPNNKDGMKPELERTETRCHNSAFRSFFNVTQFMIFSNNEEYDDNDKEHIKGSYYATPSNGSVFFSLFREEDNDLYSKVCINEEVDDEIEKEILFHRNCQQLKSHPEYKTNLNPNTPANRILTSMLSRERLLFILRYSIVYVNHTKTEKDDNGNEVPIVELQEHIMRYQQLFATFAIRRKLDSGANGGIIWHTQGSGKTALTYYNVKSLTDYFSKSNTPVKFYFIVDRIDLLEQAQTEFSERGLIVRTFQDRDKVMEDIKNNVVADNSNGKPEIAVINIQKFASDGSHITKKEVYSTNLRRIFFIDEAHRGYSPKGSFLANLLQADDKAIRIALTGTPLIKEELESWRVFGNYIHTYYYDKSIADGYTLKLLREDIETVYKEEITKIIDTLTNEVKVKKSDIDHNVIIENKTYCSAVLDYILRDMRRSRIQLDSEHMGGMIVCETNTQARVIYELFKETEHGNSDAMTASLILHDEGNKEERKGYIEEFKKTTNIDVLIVNAMLLTGFDAPRLKKLYLLRKLDGHNLLQALTRVNRLYQNFKYGYVVDFANIKENFIDTNNLYMKELNRTNESEDGQDNGVGAGVALMLSNDEIIQQMTEIKETMFQYATENAEMFSQQLESITDKEQLYKLRNTLENAKALTNQVRSFGDKELKERFERLQIGIIPSLISEVSHRIQRINLLESTDHKADVSGIIREALSMMQFEFRQKGKEELRIYYNDLRERYSKVESEFSSNFDTEEDAYVLLSEDFRKYFAKKGFTPDTVADAREDIHYMDEVMAKIKMINQANAVLKAKYHDDEKYARVHKRIVEENRKRESHTPKLKVLISPKEVEIVDGLNAIKNAIDEQVYLDYNKLNNEAYFDQMVMSGLFNQLHNLHIETERTDRRWLCNKIASEYLDGYRDRA